MKKLFAILLVFSLFAVLGTSTSLATSAVLPPAALSGLTNNCPNTGIMIPEAFDPLVSTYLLTVASWVSRVTFTPVSADPQAAMTVNGLPVSSGQPSQIIAMTDAPQAVAISVTASSGESSVYTVFLQRRPSEMRNSVSAAYLMGIDEQDGKTYLSLDLVSLTFAQGNLSGFMNETIGDIQKYPLSPNCIFYSGTGEDVKMLTTAQEFKTNLKLDGNELFYVVFIEDEIRAVIPYLSNALQGVRLTAAPGATPITNFIQVTPAPDGGLVTIREGDGGALVAILQGALRGKGYYQGEVDGLYGTATTDAVLNFQNDNKLLKDGIAGDDTQKLLYGVVPAAVIPENTTSGSFVIVTPAPNGDYVLLKEGDMGELVTKLQQALTNKGFFKGIIDSFYGPDTKDAITAFQDFHGLKQDGIASPATLMVLFEGKYPVGS